MKEDGWKIFLRICSNLKSEKELEKFLTLFLTIEEKEQVSARARIIQELLKRDLTQREIAERCEVSIAQITRGSNALKVVDPEFKELLRKML